MNSWCRPLFRTIFMPSRLVKTNPLPLRSKNGISTRMASSATFAVKAALYRLRFPETFTLRRLRHLPTLS
ncbi:MAG: hypothetical protein AAGD08_20245 [Pseudomonadota bacterium]